MSLIIFFIVTIIVFTLFVDLLNFFFNRAPFLPSNKKALKSMLDIYKFKDNDRVVDLGSGDARILTKLAKKNVKSHGYEIDPFLVWFSRLKVRLLGLENLVTIEEKDFLKGDFSSFNVFIIYGIKGMMPKVESKLLQEADKGSVVISNKFTFKNLKHVRSINNVHLYKTQKKG